MKRLLFAAILALCWTAISVIPGSAQEPILVGVPTSVTFIEGKECLKAVELAVAEINAKGGIKVGDTKRLLKIESLDLRDASPGVPVSEALLGLEKIITEKKVQVILVGPFRSEALIPGMDILNKYKVPLLGTIAMSPKSEMMVKENPEKYKYCFRVCLNAIYLGKYLSTTLGFLKNQFGFNKVYAMHQDVLWAKATADGTVKGATTNFGWESVGIEAYPTGASDFAAGLMKAKTLGAQVILPVFDMPQSGILLKQWQSMKIPALISGFISPMTGPGAWKVFEGKIGGLMNCNYELGSGIAPAKYPPAKKFYDDYRKKFGEAIESGHGPGPAYDSVYIWAEAVERAGGLDPDKVVAELKKTDRQGVIGKIKFDDGNQVIYGDDPTKAACGCVFQWTEGGGGKRVVVWPETLAEGKVVLPSWIKAVK
ncbi:MAG: ABC transporter substrate-binding protein [Desulfomonilaceae bacterium]